MSQSFTPQDERILETLDRALWTPTVTPIIQAIADRVEQKLAMDAAATLAWEPVPLETYGEGLPEMILSSWVFVLRKGMTSGAERHPNSHQRVTAFHGKADFQLWEDGAWRSHILIDDPSRPLRERWVSIPVGGWHKPVMGEEDWTVVSFHTATQSELIEERGDPENRSDIRRQTYASRSDSGFLGAR